MRNIIAESYYSHDWDSGYDHSYLGVLWGVLGTIFFLWIVGIVLWVVGSNKKNRVMVFIGAFLTFSLIGVIIAYFQTNGWDKDAHGSIHKGIQDHNHLSSEKVNLEKERLELEKARHQMELEKTKVELEKHKAELAAMKAKKPAARKAPAKKTTTTKKPTTKK